MADPLSVVIRATGQSSRALYQTVQSFRNHQRATKQLSAELEGLNGVLGSLESWAGEDETVFLPLRLPLVQCRQACADFEALLVKCSKHSGGPRTSFRDWARLRYMGSDISGFTSMLAGYKSTMCIALADANLRSTSVTLGVLNQYKDMIESTAQDLEDHLQEIKDKLRAQSTLAGEQPAALATEIERIRSEQSSAEKCLEICNSVLQHINEMHFLPDTNQQASSSTAPAAPFTTQNLTQADAMTLLTLRTCSDKLCETISQLHDYKEIADAKSQKQPETTAEAEPEGSGVDSQTLQGELDSAAQCLAICKGASNRAAEARVHVLENITMGDDGKQLFVSTLGDLFDVRGVSAGHRAVQFIGSVSDATFREFLRS